MPQSTAYRPTPANPNTTAARESLAAAKTAIEDLDDFLDEVDDLLEVNAMEVVRAYVQQPGQ